MRVTGRIVDTPNVPTASKQGIGIEGITTLVRLPCARNVFVRLDS